MGKGAEILSRLLKDSGLNANSFSKEIGLSRPQVLYDIENGKIKNISARLAKKITKRYPGYNLNWLLTGKGSMLIGGDGNNSHNSDSFIGVDRNGNGSNRGNTTNNYYGGCSEKQEQENARKMLIGFRPRIPIDAAVGSLAIITEDGEKASEYEMYPKIGQFPAYDFTTFVRGDSMEPRYERGAEIACKRINGSGFIQWGRVHVLDTSQGTVIKQIYDDGDNIRCKSINEAYPDFSIPKEEIYSINLVVGKITFE